MVSVAKRIYEYIFKTHNPRRSFRPIRCSTRLRKFGYDTYLVPRSILDPTLVGVQMEMGENRRLRMRRKMRGKMSFGGFLFRSGSDGAEKIFLRRRKRGKRKRMSFFKFHCELGKIFYFRLTITRGQAKELNGCKYTVKYFSLTYFGPIYFFSGT